MTDSERAICERVKDFRLRLRISQAKFAEQVGITRDQLASIEYGRTPLRYDIAWRIRYVFGISIDWLWGGDSQPDDLSADDKLPAPSPPGIGENTLLTEVFNKLYGLTPEDNIPPRIKKPNRKTPKIDPDEIAHRSMMRLLVELELDLQLPRIPDGHVKDFSDKLVELMRLYVKQLPTEPDELIEAREQALLWERIRSQIARHATSLKYGKDFNLTETESDNKTGAVKELLPTLRARLNKLTESAGKKTELAEFLGAPLASVSRWLSGNREPGGEVALKMLHWVELQERK